MKKVIVIVGPTATGKTSLSIEIAKKYHAEVINGDSVQVYEGLDIGSAKIKSEEKKGIKHHLFDVLKPSEQYSVFDFQKDARRLISEINLPLIVGGTGLYIKAALYNYEFREKGRDHLFDEMHKHLSNVELYDQLLQIDPSITIDSNNRRRVLRALEQALDGELRSHKNHKDDLLYDALIIYLDIDRNILEGRLKSRIEKQIEDGFIEEVIKLDQQKIRINAIGYKELHLYLEGLITLDEAKQTIVKASKRLAKKQKTFFKNQMNPIMLDALSPSLVQDVSDLIDEFLNRS